MLFDTPFVFIFLVAVVLCYLCLSFRNQNKFPREYFRDGFHLNTIGSGIFTSRLAQRVRTLQNVQANCNGCRREQSAK
jgi:maltodextrin utilization protein YvdJ